MFTEQTEHGQAGPGFDSIPALIISRRSRPAGVARSQCENTFDDEESQVWSWLADSGRP